jgi:hypothetical protein
MTVDRVAASTNDDQAAPAVPDATTVAASGADSPVARQGLARFAPAVVAAAVAAIGLVTHGVGIVDVIWFAIYWTMCLVVPGLLIARALIGTSDTLTEEVAIGALTGLALEAVSLFLLDAMGLHGAIRWWWVIVYVVFAAHPRLRRFWSSKPSNASPPSWAWAMSALTVVGTAIATQSFRSHELPPTPSAPYVDHFFHLSLVNEMTRQGPHQVPQVAGEPLAYHVFSHAHMANASTITGVAPEVVLSRLWILPVMLLTMVLLGVLALRVTNRPWSSPVAVWLSFFALYGNSIWTDRSVTLVSPFTIASPSQLFANPVFIGGCLAFIGVLRSARSWHWSLLFILYAAVGVGAKPTVLPALFGGAVLATGALWILHRRIPVHVAVCACALLVIQFGWLLLSPPIEGKITILGSIDSLAVFREVNGSGGLRAVSETLVLDRLDDGRAWLAAGIAMLWLSSVQVIRLIGLGTLVARSTRRDPVAWWLAGTYAAGWGAFFLIDQAGFGQAYFALTAIPAGAVLSCWFLSILLDRVQPRQRAAAIGTGFVLGTLTSLAVRGAVAGRSTSPAYGPVESALLPVVLVSVVGIVAIVALRASDRQPSGSGAAPVIGVVFVLSLSFAPAIGEISRLGGSLLTEQPAASESSANFVSRDEQEAMLWLRDNTPSDAVIATNAHCRPPNAVPDSCDARSFVVSGLGGRRVVLEGWAYTPQSNSLHGTNGRSFAVQPSPWPARLRLSEEAVAAPNARGLDLLAEEFGTGWIVGFRRAGPVSADLADFAEAVFDNGAVAIFRLNPISD